MTADMARTPTAPPGTDARCWPFPCRDYHATYAHESGEDPCACACHEPAPRNADGSRAAIGAGRKRPGSLGPFGY